MPKIWSNRKITNVNVRNVGGSMMSVPTIRMGAWSPETGALNKANQRPQPQKP